MDCSLLDSSVHGIFQSRILEWVAIPFSRAFSQPRDWTHISCTVRQTGRLLWSFGDIMWAWFFHVPWILHGCLHIWNSSHILQSLLTAHSNVFKLLLFCSWTTSQRANESLQYLQSGLRSVYLLPDAQLGEMSPGSLGVWYWIQQVPPRHLYSWMNAELLLLLGGEK